MTTMNMVITGTNTHYMTELLAVEDMTTVTTMMEDTARVMIAMAMVINYCLLIIYINVKKTYQFKTQCKDDMVISDI